MSRSVEERIVEMQFDNAQFESGVKTSIKSLNQLEQSLQLKGATRGIEEVEKASKRLDMSTLLGAIDAVGQKISKLDNLGQMYIRKWKNEAINLVRSVAKEFTINPVKTGMQEYETQINSIQTILANTKRHGSTLADVNAALDDLNYYADKTIYNFTQMTNAIGMFTTQGVELERSTESVKGIANLAAFVGAPASDATRAMYQLSQALSLGSVRLQDWMSLEHTAGMAGKEFQDRLIATARIHNTGVDAALKKNGNFRESLKEGWLTTEVLTETLKQFTETTEGLTESQIKQKRDYWSTRGYTEQQIDDIFELGKTATDAATKVKTFTQLMDTMKENAQSGWTRSWQLIIGDFEEAKELLTSLSDRFGKLIAASANSRNKLLEDWKNLGGRQVLIDAFDVVFKIGQDLSASITKAFQSVFPSLTGSQLNELTKSLKRGLNAIEEFLWSPLSEEETWPVIYYIQQGIKGFISILGVGWNIAKTIFKAGLSLIEKCKPFLSWVVLLGSKIGETLSFVNDAVFSGKKVEEVLDGIITRVSELINSVPFLGKKTVDAEASAISNTEDFGSKIRKVLDKISGYLSGINWGNALLKGGILFFSVKLFKTFFSVNKLIGSLGEVAETISGVFESIGKSLKSFINKNRISTILKLALVFGILAASVYTFSKVSWEDVGKAGASMAALGAGLFMMSKYMPAGRFKNGGQIILLAYAFKELVGPLSAFSAIPWDGLARAGAGMAGLSLILLGFTTLIGKAKIRGATKFIFLAKAIEMLVEPIQLFASLSWEGLGKAGAAIGGLGAIGMLLQLLSKGMKLTDLGFFVVMAQAIKEIGQPVKDISSIPWSGLGKAVLGITALGGLAIIVSNVFSKMKGTVKGALKFMMMIFPLIGLITAIAVALDVVREIDPSTITSFALSFGGMLAAIAASLFILKGLGAGGSVVAGASLIAVITAIGVAARILARLSAGALTTFTNSLNIVGPNLKYFSEQIASLSEGGFQAAADCIGTMAAAFKDVVGVNLNEVQNFTYALTDIGYGLYAFNNLTKDVVYNPETEKDVEFVLGLQNRFNGFDSTAISTALLDVATSFYLFNALMDESGGTGSYQTGSGTGFAQWLNEVVDELPDDDSIYQVAQYADESSKNSMYGFAQGLTAIGGALRDYGTAFDTVDSGKVNAANETVGLMADLEGDLNSFKKVIAKVVGIDDDLSKFGTRIGELGVGIGNYIKSIGDAGESVSEDKITLACDTLKMLIGLEKDLPNTGNSIWNWLSGATELQDFGAKLVSLGSNLSEFFTKIGQGDIPSDIDRRIEVSANALSSFLGIKTNSGVGAYALEMFTKGMPAFVPNIKTFLEGLSGINADFNKADKVLAYVRQFKEQKDDLNDVMTALGGFADKAVWGNNGENFNAAVNGIVGLFDVLEKGRSITSGDVSWLSQLFTQMDEASIAEAAAGLATSFFGSFGGSFTELLNGVAENVTTACEQLWQAGSNELGGEPAKAAWETAGSNLTLGFANGIRSQIGAAVDAATALGNAAASALNTSLDEHSPSKRTMKSGVFFNEGFINGMTSTLGQVANAAADVGTSAVNKLEKSGFLAGLPQNGRLTAKLNIGSDVHAVSGNDAADKGSPSTIGGAINDAIDRGVNKLKPWLNDPAGQIKDTVDKAGKRVGEVVDGAKSLLSGDWDSALEGIFGKDAYTKAEAIYDMINGDLSKVDQLYPNMDAETKKYLTQLGLYGKNDDEKVNGASSGSSGSSGSKNESGTASSGTGKGTGSYSYAQASSAGDKLRELTRIRDLFEAINNVGIHVNDLGEAVANMQIVMDSGVMVGQIETRMDSRLGAIAGVKGRGL